MMTWSLISDFVNNKSKSNVTNPKVNADSFNWFFINTVEQLILIYHKITPIWTKLKSLIYQIVHFPFKIFQ